MLLQIAVQFLEPRGGGNTLKHAKSQYTVDKTYGGGQPHMIVNHSNSLVAQHRSRIIWFYQQNQPPQNQQNYTRMDEDPFANSKGPIEVSEDDLPF